MTIKLETDGVDDDEAVAEYPVTEKGLLQLLEGINRATQDEEISKAKSAAKHNSKLKLLIGNRDSCLVKLTRLRDGDFLPFDDGLSPTPVDDSVTLDDGPPQQLPADCDPEPGSDDEIVDAEIIEDEPEDADDTGADVEAEQEAAMDEANKKESPVVRKSSRGKKGGK